MRMPRLTSSTDVYYLPAQDLMLVREHHTQDGWRCGVVASRQARDGHVDVTDDELSTAVPLADVTMNAMDPDGLAMLWLAQVYSQSPGSRLYTLTRVLAQELREPGQLVIAWSPQRLMHQTNMRPELIEHMLSRLANNGFLSRRAKAKDTGTMRDCGVGTVARDSNDVEKEGEVLVLEFPPAEAPSLSDVLGSHPRPVKDAGAFSFTDTTATP